MNRALVWRLIVKDWYLNRVTLALIAVAGALSIGLLFHGGETAGFVGFIAALIVAIFLSILLPMQTVVNERKQQNLPFVMSLPISPMEYTTAKVLGNLSAFSCSGWRSSSACSSRRERRRLRLLPFAFIAALAPFVAFCLLLAVAIVIESERWAMATMGAVTCRIPSRGSSWSACPA